MLEFEKSELDQVLYTIATYSAPKEGEVQKMISGLLQENISLGLKRRLQKIQTKTQVLYKEYTEDIKELIKECGEDKERLEKEFDILRKEKVKVDEEPVKMSLIEDISSPHSYNFTIIEKFAN